MRPVFFLRLAGGCLLLCSIMSSCSKQAAEQTPNDQLIKTPQQSRISLANDKAVWIADAFSTLGSGRYPAIKAIAWWHEDFDDTHLRIDSSPESLKAYQDGIKNPLYADTLTFLGNKLVPDASRIYHAAFPDFGGTEDVVKSPLVTDFEQLAGKKIAWAYFSSNWYQNIAFPGLSIQAIRNAGTTPFIRLLSRSNFNEGGPDPKYTMEGIIKGNFDVQLKAYATQIRQLGFPVLMEFGTEVNGDWFPWNGRYCGGGTKTGYGDPAYPDGPERFRDAYRHIIDLFRANQADNITWFFHVDAYSQPDVSWNHIRNYYPGDSYIDWIGVSMYGAQDPEEDAQPFSEIMSDVYDSLTDLTDKPIAVLEWGTTEK